MTVIEFAISFQCFVILLIVTGIKERLDNLIEQGGPAPPDPEEIKIKRGREQSW